MDHELKEQLVEALAPVVSRVRTDVTAIKADGRQAWTNEPLTAARLMKHVNGSGPARGCCPIKEGEAVTMLALLDLDSHKGEIDWPAMATWAERISDAAGMHGLEAIPFRSSGGNGIHLIFVWDEPQDARSVRCLLRDVLASVALRDGTGGLMKGEVEIFPKQDRVPVGGRGNQFILPLAGASEPLLPLAGYEPMGKDAAIGLAWPVSEPVPVLEGDSNRGLNRGLSDENGVDSGFQGNSEIGVEIGVLRSALAAIPNEDAAELDYDAWRNVVFAIHAETGGSDEGLALAHEFSARSGKYDGDFLDERVWPYIRDREGGVTGRTILAMAREHGWQEDISALFEPIVVAGEGGDLLAPEDDLPGFERARNGVILATIDNVVRALGVYGMAGCRIAFDEFRAQLMITNVRDGRDGWRAISDTDEVELRRRLAVRGFREPGKDLMRDCVRIVAENNRFDSAILWARQLVWDGVRRVEGFYSTYFNVEDSDYCRAVSLYTWTAMAGRCLRPGIKADMSPVLIGDQGLRKSTGISAMAPTQEQFVELDLGAKDDDATRMLRGVLVAEFGEMRGFGVRSTEHIKAFLSRSFDTWIPKYFEYKSGYGRRALFIGTGNQKQFLTDETGNRRWLPLDVGKVEVDMIVRDRDQLWAEAIVLFNEGGIQWSEAEVLATNKHADYMVSDEWEHAIADWLAGTDEDGKPRSEGEYTLIGLASSVLGIFQAAFDHRLSYRLGKIMRGLGWRNVARRDGKNVQKRWCKAPEAIPPEDL